MTMATKSTAQSVQTAPALPVRMSLIKEISGEIRRPFLIGMAILLTAGLGSYFALQSYRISSLEVARSDKIISLLNDLLSNIDQSEAAERGYLTLGSSPDGDGSALTATIHQDLNELQKAVSEGAIAQGDSDALRTQVEARLKFFDQLGSVRGGQGEAAATAMFTAGQSAGRLSAIHDRVHQMTSAQERLLAAYLADEHLLSHLLGFLVISGCILAFGAVAYAGYFVENALKLIGNHLNEDASGREALAALNETLEERINERSAAAAQCARDLERARKDLHHQGQILQAVFDFISEGVLVCDTHMRVLQTNAAAKRLLGADFGQRSLDHLPKVFEMIDPVAARPLEAREWPLAQAVRGHQCQLDFQLRDRQNGEVHLIESRSIPLLYENGTVHAAVALLRDLTPAVKSEQRAALLDALAAHSDDAFIEVKRDGRVASWSPAATRLFGYAPEEIIGHTCRRIVSDEAVTLTREVSQRMLAGGGPERLEFEAVRKDGSHVPIMIHAIPLSETRGIDAGFMLICRNQSEQKLLKAETAAAHAVALEAAGSRFEFLINMSHEFQTSLERIAGVIPLLLESSLSAQQRDCVRAIASSSEGLLQAVRDISDLTALTSGKADFDQSEFDLYETVEGAIDIAAEEGQGKDIELVLNMGPDLPRRLIGDRARLAQILATLADSSIKFNDHGEVVVKVDCEERGEGFTALRFEVRGTGAGVPVGLQARLFQPFMTSNDRAGRELGGTGLGLAIAAQLVERIGGGSITVGGEPGHSSVLRFTLRFANVPEVDKQRDQWPELAPRRILVVDDCANSRVSICGQLVLWGFGPDSAIGGAEALLAMRQRSAAGAPYGLVLADMRMHGMDGFALHRAIKADPHLARAQLVIMGPYGVPEQPDTDGWLVKPIKPTRLFDCLDRLTSGATAAARFDAPATADQTPRLQTPASVPDGTGLNRHTQAISYPSLDHSVLDGLRALSGPNGGDVVGVLATAFTCDLPMRIAQLEMAVAAGDMSALKTRAAGLRGLAAGLGLARMAALCASLTVHAEHGEPGLAAGALATIRDEAASVLPLLEREAGLNPTEGEAAA
jgi:PAS domain S-box-containing protein